MGLSILGCTTLDTQKALASSTTKSKSVKQTVQNSLIINRNEEAIKNIVASKKHLDTKYMGYVAKSHSNLFTLAHLSDIHTDSKRYRNFQEFVDGVDAIDAAICTGDFVIAAKKEEFDYIHKVEFKKTFLKVIGNHERARVENATLPFVYERLGLHTNTGELYYYHDFAEYKIRIIALNQFDIDAKGSVNSAVEHYSQTQINWFIDTLKDAQSRGYAVAVAMHAPNVDMIPKANNKAFYQRHYGWIGECGSVISGPIIEDIIDVFRHGGTIKNSYTYADVPGLKTVADATFTGGGIFMAYMVGHEHADFIGYSNFHADQLYLMMNVSCCMPEYANYNFGEEVSDLARIEETHTEDCFNVYSFDVENKLIKVVRVGSDVNDLMEDRKKACYSFDGLI